MTATDFGNELRGMAERAKQASRRLATMSSTQRNQVLQAIARELIAQKECILAANVLDLQNARERGLSAALLDRLALDLPRIEEMAKGLQTLVGLADPVGRVDSTWLRPNGLKIEKVRVPIGVIAIIYEARPNVTIDAAGLCLKAGNAVFLRGGSEAFHSNRALAQVMLAGGRSSGLPDGAVEIVPWTDREAVTELLKLDEWLDLVIPRGGESLIRAVVEQSRIPVIKHYKGVCHTYVDKAADQEMALRIVENAKCQRAGVCNAVETVLIHEAIAQSFAPRLAALLLARGVELRGDAAFCSLVPQPVLAQETDWYEEYLDLVLAVRIVKGTAAAAEHIAKYGSAHSDAIVTEDKKASAGFVSAVDSAVVYVNASTRFTDGGQFGMGAEIGISTDRIHARGPMGLQELTTYKYVVRGTGQVRA